MRASLKAALLIGLIVAAVVDTAPAALAADLTVVRGKRVVHHRVRVVADYDGTPIVLRRTRPVLVPGPDGPVAVRYGLYDAYAVLGATPSRYFNGQRIR